MRAFEDLVERHAELAIGAAVRVTRDRGLAEDAAQEAFLKVYRCLNRYREENRFEPWLCRITQRCALDLLRRRRETAGEEVALRATDEGRQERQIEDRDLLRRALAKISPLDRGILLSLKSEGLTVEETGRRYSMSPTAVGVRAHRARKKLRKLLMRTL